MNEWVPDHSAVQAQIKTVHVSLGITIFLLVLLRIAIRLFWPPPPLPATTPGWAKAGAIASHTLFYVLMVLLPLSGWAIVSLGSHPIQVWACPGRACRASTPSSARILPSRSATGSRTPTSSS